MIGWILKWIVAIGLFAGALYLCFAGGAAWLAITAGVIALFIAMLAMVPSGGPADFDEDDQSEA
jgi:hypothetical protein